MDDATLSRALLEAAQRLQALGAGHDETARALAHLSDALNALRLHIPATFAADDLDASPAPATNPPLAPSRPPSAPASAASGDGEDTFDTFDPDAPDASPDASPDALDQRRPATLVEDPALLQAALGARPPPGVTPVGKPVAPPAQQLQPPLPPHSPQISRLEPGSELGRGGMGRVVEAFDPLLQRRVAVKFLLDPQRVTPRRMSRFVAEAQITAQLDHPNIVPVHEFGMSPTGDVYLIMKRVRGRSLRDVLLALRVGDQRARAQWDRYKLLRAFWHVCQALAYAHGRGVLHRDLKPDNIMLGDFGEVYVMDWGVARLIGQPELLPELSAPYTTQHSQIRRVTGPSTLDGASIGTPGYMSPEQIEGLLDQLTPASDIWSMGAILYELLTLRPAFDAPTALEILVRSASYATPPDPAAAASASDPVPAELSRICAKALARAPADRYPDATALGAAVAAFLDGTDRRAAAERELEAALRRRLDLDAAEHAILEVQAAADALTGFFPPHASLADKAPLRALQDQLDNLRLARARALQDTLNACERALSQDPDHAPSRKLLTDLYWRRLYDAEAAYDRASASLHASRIALYGTLSDRLLLEGSGHLSLDTTPPRAHVTGQRVRRQGLLWSLDEPQVLGPTPLRRVPLPMGAYLLTITHPADGSVTRYPIHITRTHHWDAGAVPLLTAAEVGPGFVYIPPGPCALGGDPAAVNALPATDADLPGFLIAARPVSVAEYLGFLNDLLTTQGVEAAYARAPRHTPTGGQRWPLPPEGAPLSLPRVDDDGDLWDPALPITSISWNDALAFCRWASARDATRYNLPTEAQWEKASRGVDRRIFPWGDRFDPTLCKMRLSRPGRPQLEPIAAFPTDCSPYGVLDVAGSARDWCADLAFNGDPDRRPTRGGAWLDEPHLCRLAARQGFPSAFVSIDIGFRLAKPLP
jgi:serine/threonine-protein kinase